MRGSITQAITLGFGTLLTIALTGCGPDYSPNTYSGSALQQANKVDTGIVIGYREVKISADGTVGAVTGGAAGGILGAEAGAPAVPTALAVLGGTVVGGVVGSTVQHATGDTTGWEYIVREPKGDLVSVTQREPTPLPVGQKVLVIEGKQARIVPDYATTYDTPPEPKAEANPDRAKAAASNGTSATAAPPAAPAAAASLAAPAAPASQSAPVSDNAANAAPIPLSGNKDQAPDGHPVATSTTPPTPAQAAPPSADSPPSATTGNGSNSPAPPP